MSEFPSADERFGQIVRELVEESRTKSITIANLEAQLQTANFPKTQATNCGICGKYKHTPWRSWAFGYICATCMVERSNRHLCRAQEIVEGLLQDKESSRQAAQEFLTETKGKDVFSDGLDPEPEDDEGGTE